MEYYTNDAWWSVRQSNMICPEVKMSTRGRSPSVDILTSGHIILEWRTMNIMHHMFCRMPNCDKKNYRRMKINNHKPITKRNEVNTDKYSTLLIVRKTAVSYTHLTLPTIYSV